MINNKKKKYLKKCASKQNQILVNAYSLDPGDGLFFGTEELRMSTWLYVLQLWPHMVLWTR
jgi:hypothetical protein